MAPKSCPFAPLSVALLLFAVQALSTSLGVSSCDKQASGGLDLVLNFHLVSNTF